MAEDMQRDMNIMDRSHRFQLRDIPRARLALHNLLATNRPGGGLPVNGPDTWFRWTPTFADAQTTWTSIQISMADRVISLIYPETMMRRVFSGSVALQSWTPDTEAILVEHFLTPAFSAVEADLDARLQVLGASPASLPDLSSNSLLFELEIAGLSEPFPAALVGLPMDLSERLACNFVSKTDDIPVKLPVALVSSPLLITADELEQLRAGDLLAFPAGQYGLETFAIAIAGQLGARVQKRGRQTVLSEPINHRHLEGLNLDITRKSGRPAAAEAADPNLTLTVELASASVPIADLQALKAGSVVPLAQKVSSSVRLLSNGIAIAEAELVTIGDTSGVQIVKLL